MLFCTCIWLCFYIVHVNVMIIIYIYMYTCVSWFCYLYTNIHIYIYRIWGKKINTQSLFFRVYLVTHFFPLKIAKVIGPPWPTNLWLPTLGRSLHGLSSAIRRRLQGFLGGWWMMTCCRVLGGGGYIHVYSTYIYVYTCLPKNTFFAYTTRSFCSNIMYTYVPPLYVRTCLCVLNLQFNACM